MTSERLKEIREVNRFWVEELSSYQEHPAQNHRSELVEYVDELEFTIKLEALESALEKTKMLDFWVAFKTWVELDDAGSAMRLREAFKNLELKS